MDNIVAAPSAPVAPITSAPFLANAPIVPAAPEEEIFSIYEATNQVPYTAKHFGLSKSQYFALTQADIGDLVPKLGAIEGYIASHISTNQLVDSTATYKAVMDEIRQTLGIKDYEKPSAQIERIYAYILGGRVTPPQFVIPRSTKADTKSLQMHRQFKHFFT